MSDPRFYPTVKARTTFPVSYIKRTRVGEVRSSAGLEIAPGSPLAGDTVSPAARRPRGMKVCSSETSGKAGLV